MFCKACGEPVEEHDSFCRRCGRPVHGGGPASTSRSCTRVKEGRMIGGVCSGFASYFAKDVTIIRIAWTLAALIPPLFPGIAAYLVGWILMPAPNGSSSSENPTGHAIASE